MEQRNIDKIKELEKEIGRYKKATETRDIVISQLREEISGQYEVAQIIAAYMSILIEDVGGVVSVPKDEITKRIGKHKMLCKETQGKYILTVTKREGL